MSGRATLSQGAGGRRRVLTVDRIIRAAGGAVLIGALVVAVCSEPAPSSRPTHEEFGQVGICHRASSGAPQWTRLDRSSWAAHREHRDDRALTAASCLAVAPADVGGGGGAGSIEPAGSMALSVRIAPANGPIPREL